MQDIDQKKREIVNHVDGPLLVIAGPGAGKTMAIVERVVRLIGVSHVAPESIFVSTFTEKAAQELLPRISRRLEDETLYVTWGFERERVAGTLQAFGRTVGKIESHQFSNAKVKKCARLCDGCDMRFYCGCK